jgi:methionyl-tRNA formyltransferase
MKVTVFTSNQPRHIALLGLLAEQGHEVLAVIETSPIQQLNPHASKARIEYFEQMFRAETKYFGRSTLAPKEIRVLAIPMGQINFLSPEELEELLESDQIVVSGSDYIKGWLVDELVNRRAINVHLGMSPYFRGSACNFWALFDGFATHVGATIHLLSRGLDSGGMLHHALPTFEGEDPFEFSMKAVAAAQSCLVELLNRELPAPVEQRRQDEIRYSRSADFTDDIIIEYLSRDLTPSRLAYMLEHGSGPELVNPYYY